MKRGCFCDIVNVNKEKQRWKNTTLGEPTRYHFTQMVPVVPKSEWSCFNCPNFIEPIVIYPNVFNCIQVSVKACILSKFEWSYFRLAKIEWSCLKLPKVEWSCSTWPKFEWIYCHLPKVALICWIYPHFSNLWKYF